MRKESKSHRAIYFVDVIRLPRVTCRVPPRGDLIFQEYRTNKHGLDSDRFELTEKLPLTRLFALHSVITIITVIFTLSHVSKLRTHVARRDYHDGCVSISKKLE